MSDADFRAQILVLDGEIIIESIIKLYKPIIFGTLKVARLHFEYLLIELVDKNNVNGSYLVDISIDQVDDDYCGGDFFADFSNIEKVW